MLSTPLLSVAAPVVPVVVSDVKAAAAGVGTLRTPPDSVAAPVPVVVSEVTTAAGGVGMFSTPLVSVAAPLVPVVVSEVKVPAEGVGILSTVPISVEAPLVPVVVRVKPGPPLLTEQLDPSTQAMLLIVIVCCAVLAGPMPYGATEEIKPLGGSGVI